MRCRAAILTSTLMACLFMAGAAFAQQPRVKLEGTLIRQSGRTVLRVEGDTYILRFPTTNLMTFAHGLLGETVRVEGTLNMRSINGQQRAVVTPESIERLGGPEAAVETPAFDDTPITLPETPLDTSLEEIPVTPYYNRVQRRKALVLDTQIPRRRGRSLYKRDFYTRVDRRKQAIRREPRLSTDYQDVLITPGGGVLIRNGW